MSQVTEPSDGQVTACPRAGCAGYRGKMGGVPLVACPLVQRDKVYVINPATRRPRRTARACPLMETEPTTIRE